MLNHRLDVILGKVGSKAKDVYESKQSLASRIVKVERTVNQNKRKDTGYPKLINLLSILLQVEDIENKVDSLLEMYLEDRNRMNTLLYSRHTSSPLSDAGQSAEDPIKMYNKEE